MNQSDLLDTFSSGKATQAEPGEAVLLRARPSVQPPALVQPPVLWSLALAGIAGISGLLGGSLLRAPELSATDLQGMDLDQDGLVDQQEQILDTQFSQADTDGDGFDDLEELARQSDPNSDTSLPATLGPSVGITGRTLNGSLYSTSAIYVPSGDLASVSFGMGVRVGELLIPLPVEVYANAASTVVVLPGAVPGSLVVMLESVFPESAIHSLASVSLYITTGPSSSLGATSAAVLNLASFSSTVLQVQGGTAGGGSVYRPLGEGDDLPATWSPGEICTQVVETVAVVGAVLKQEVISSSCEAADTFCPPECPLQVGTVIDVLDPFSLIGG